MNTPGRPVIPGSSRGVAPGRDHEAVELQPATVCERDRTRRQIEVLRRRSELELDPERVELVRCLERAPIDVPCTREELLGEWRTIVWKVGLVADQGHATLEAVLAESLAGT